ncbi:hypothetical protein ABMY26_30240 [Azospirillum sp. HJ39]
MTVDAAAVPRNSALRFARAPFIDYGRRTPRRVDDPAPAPS